MSKSGHWLLRQVMSVTAKKLAPVSEANMPRRFTGRLIPTGRFPVSYSWKTDQMSIAARYLVMLTPLARAASRSAPASMVPCTTLHTSRGIQSPSS